MSVNGNLIIIGILLLSGYPHPCSYADIQSLNLLISTTSTACDLLGDSISYCQKYNCYIFLSSQIANAISTPFISYGCDKSLPKRITKKYGNIKIWHLLGSAGSALIWFVFSPCLICNKKVQTGFPLLFCDLIYHQV